MSTLRTGARTPFFATDIPVYHDLTASDFSPIEDLSADPTLAELSACEVYTKSGFIVMNATASEGYLSVITWEAWQRNGEDLTGLVPVRVFVPSGGFVYTPVVKVFQSADPDITTTTTSDDGALPSTVSYINIHTIR